MRGGFNRKVKKEGIIMENSKIRENKMKKRIFKCEFYYGARRLGTMWIDADDKSSVKNNLENYRFQGHIKITEQSKIIEKDIECKKTELFEHLFKITPFDGYRNLTFYMHGRNRWDVFEEIDNICYPDYKKGTGLASFGTTFLNLTGYYVCEEGICDFIDNSRIREDKLAKDFAESVFKKNINDARELRKYKLIKTLMEQNVKIDYESYDDFQLHEIECGARQGLDINKFLDKNLTGQQMEKIRLDLKNNKLKVNEDK